MKLPDANLLRLLPEHLSGDAQFAAAGEALRPYLGQIARFIPNLLIYARLGNADWNKFLPPLRRLTEARPGLDPLDMETLESLAWQFHVDFREVARNERELAGMVRDSIAWHRIKGTPASIRAALELCGFLGVTLEEFDPNMHWATYQMGFAELASLEELARIVAICHEMQPARCRLWRVYVDDFDIRPGTWSGPAPRNLWSYACWSYYSGQYIPELPGLDDRGLMVSFGLKRRFQGEAFIPGQHLAHIWQELLRSYLIREEEPYIWSYSRWSEAPLRRHGFTGSQILAGQAADTLYCDSGTWLHGQGLWSDLRWASSCRWDRLLPAWSMSVRGICKSQGVWSDASDKIGAAWSGLNCNWSAPSFDILPRPPLWSGHKWSDRQETVRRELIAEQFREILQAGVEGLEPAFSGRSGASGSQMLRQRLRGWRGAIWGESSYGDAFSQNRGFAGASSLAALAGEALLEEADYWGVGDWDGRPWMRISGYGRRQQKFHIVPSGQVSGAIVSISRKDDTAFAPASHFSSHVAVAGGSLDDGICSGEQIAVSGIKNVVPIARAWDNYDWDRFGWNEGMGDGLGQKYFGANILEESL